MPAPLTVSCLVLNYRTPKVAELCVKALLNQTIADHSEILLIDNHSQDDSVGYLRNRFGNCSQVHIVETPKNLGYGQGNAAAVRLAQGSYLLIVNPDTHLERDALEKMLDALERDPTIGIIAPKLVHDDGDVRDSGRRLPRVIDVILKRFPFQALWKRRLDYYLARDLDPQATHDVEWIVGACFLIRRNLWDRLGGFDPRFFLFFEDIDLCRRVRNMGLRIVYFPSAIARDRKERLSEGGLWSLLKSRAGREHLRSACKYFWKWSIR